MDHSGPWPTYAQHYPRLSSNVSPAQASQLSDLSLTSSLQRQDPMAGYGLLPAHHVSQGVTHTDSTYVNSANMLSAPYDPLMTNFPPSGKGHHSLGALGMPHGHNAALFKNLSKETEINELRGGFSRQAGLSPGAMVPGDPNLGMAGSTAMSSPNLYNPQSSPHAWRTADMMPTPSSPFGVLPHETVSHRSNVETGLVGVSPAAKSHQQVAVKASRSLADSGRYAEAELSYRNVLLDPSNGVAPSPRTPMMMTGPPTPTPQGDNSASSEPMSLTSMKPDYIGYHGNPAAGMIGNQQRSLLEQNYLPHAQFSSIEMHGGSSGAATKAGDMYAAMKTPEASDVSSNSEMYVDTMAVNTSNSVTSPVSAHNPSRIQHAPGPGTVAVSCTGPVGTGPSGPSAIVAPSNQSSPSSNQSQPHDLSSSYATYSTTPTIPTHSQSFLANQMPAASPSMSEMEYSSPQQVGVIATQGNAGPPGGHHMSEMPNVAYSSVITRTNAVAPQMSPGAFPPEAMIISDTQTANPPPKPKKRRGRPPKNASMYNSGLKAATTADSSLVNMAMNCGKDEMLGDMLVSPADNVDAIAMNGSGPHSDSSRQPLTMDSMFNGQDVTLDELASVTGDNSAAGKLDMDALLSSADDPSVATPLVNDEVTATQRGKKRRRRKRKGVVDDDEVDCQIPPPVTIGPMTPLSAGKLGHKVAPPLSQLSASSPLSPMDLSSGDGPPPLQHLPVDDVISPSGSGINGSVAAAAAAAAEAAAKARQSIEEEFCASGLANCIVETSATNCDLDSDTEQDDDDGEDAANADNVDFDGSSSSPLPDEREPIPDTARASIEADLSFLAELPAACNIKKQPPSRIPTYASRPSAQEGFLKTFLQFVKGEVTPPLAPLGPNRRGRGRGGRGGWSRSALSRAEEAAKSELNPTTGLFIPRNTPTPPDSVEPVMDVFADLVSPPDSPTKDKLNNGRSDGEGLDTTNDNDDDESTTSSRRPANQPSVVFMTSSPGVDGVKIKLVGLQSGKVQKARRGGWSGRGQNVARRGRGKTKTGLVSPPTPEGEYNYEPAGGSEDIQEVEEPPPRRLSMRKCKEKTLQKRQERLQRRSRHSSGGYGFGSDSEDFHSNASSESEKELPRYDSDSDPAWTADREESEKEASLDEDDDDDYEPISGRIHGRGRRRSRTGSRGKRPRLGGSGSDSQSLPGPGRRGRQTGFSRVDDDPVFDVGEGAGKVGDFVIAVADLAKPPPTPIWRIDSKRLLQKFEPSEENGRLLYRGKSMYSGWTANTRVNYQPITVRMVSSNLRNMIVEYHREDPTAEKPEEEVVSKPVDEIVIEDGEEEGQRPAEQAAEEKEAVEPDEEFSELLLRKENFEVYIQTLISRSLDPTFISEIIKEKDEYFLSHVQEIDAVVERCKNHMLSDVTWDDDLKECIERYPCVTTSIPSSSEDESPCCEVCSTLLGSKSVQFKGQQYDYTTLMYGSEDGNEEKEQEEEMSRRFLMCSKCFESTSLYSRIHHQKFNFYIHCDSKVKNIRESDPSQESHIILELCLKDAVWMNKLFEDVLAMWRQCLRLPR